MTDLTNPVETIVSVLGNSTTGIGTGVYLIKDDNNNNLTISGAQLLVSFTMSKEELKDAFGGSQDYDVIFTVKSGEIEDEWIGLSTKIWKVPIIITIHVIDKWSAVATKYITAPLVLYKAVNALRTFIKAKTKSPGGTINIWKALSFKNEEDTSVKPTLFKCVVTTEAWMYYNPNPAGVDTITVTFNSERDDEAESNLGTITESGTVHDLPASATKVYGDRIQVTYTAGSGDEFSSWSVSGLVVVEDSTANPTYMRVNGTGTLTAVYHTLSCLLLTSAPTDADQFYVYASYPRRGQHITINGTICQIIFKLKKKAGGSPTGTLYCRIRKVSDDSIMETSSDTVDVSTIPGTSTNYTFSFNCVVDEDVYILVEYTGGSINNSVGLSTQKSNTIDGVGVLYYNPGAGWTYLDNPDDYDHVIYIYTLQ